MSARCNVEVVPVDHPQNAADADIVVTATTSRTPVFEADWLRPGAHLNVVGSNYSHKAEVDSETVRRSRIIVDSVEACQVEAGELIQAAQVAAFDWKQCVELGTVLIGTARGRQSPDEITLFKSVGLAIEDIATAKLLLD
jgi:ornithine cyclodeaminase/alanine dehydrogenase-like protein (mu-crystallin family)